MCNVKKKNAIVSGGGRTSPQAAQEAIDESYLQLTEGDVASHPVATHLPLYLLYAPLRLHRA